MSSKNKNRGIIILLLVLILAIGFLSYLNATDYHKLQEAFNDEKKELELELNKIITDYDEVISQKIEVSSSLREKRTIIVNLKDSVKNLSEENYGLIRGFRKRISTLEKENRLLFAQVDSLNQVNGLLQVENISVRQELNKQTNINKKIAKRYVNLKHTNKELESTIDKVSTVEIDGLEIIAMKRKSGGKYTTTSRSKRTDAFKINLTFLANEYAKSEVKKLYVSIIDENKNVISADGNTILKNGKRLLYSDVFNVNYDKKEISFVSLAEVDSKIIHEGKYTVNVYLDGVLIGNRVLELK
ncbi:hypothetical protein [Tenacibaculum geojense]|uniref:Chromosome segregation protein SMC n=1 Tax=Tenacibaculum geojense TaxID=915352 RepID=A0ABW3JPS8_9FLAO